MKKRFIKSLLVFSIFAVLPITTLVSCNNQQVTTPESYSISANNVDGVEIKLSKTTATEGEEVTFTIEVTNEEKVLNEVSVTGDDKSVEVSKSGDTYSFLMPNYNVTINVTLKDKVFEPHNIRSNEVEDWSLTYLVNNQEVTTATRNDLVTVEVTSTSTTTRFVSLTSEDVTLTKVAGDDLTFTFTMIDEEVYLNLAVENIPLHNLSIDIDEGATGTFLVEGSPTTSALEDQEVTFELTIKNGYLFKSISWEGITLEDTYQGTYTFAMPKNDVKVKVVTEKIPSYAINYSAVDGANVSFEVAGSEVTTAKEGDVVTVAVEVLEGYLFKNLSVASSAGEVALTTVKEGATYTFVMPAESVNVTLEVELAKKDYAISSIEFTDKDFTVVTEDFAVGSKFTEGSEVTLQVQGSLSRNFDSLGLYVNDQVYFFTKDEGYSETFTVKFIMPNKDADLVVSPMNNPVEEGGFKYVVEGDTTLFDVYGFDFSKNYVLDVSSYSNTYFYLISKAGVVVHSVKLYIDDNNYNSFNASESYSEKGLYSFYPDDRDGEPTEKVRIVVDAEYVGINTVTIVNPENLEISGLQESYTPGDDVSFEVVAKEGYFINGVSATTEDNSYLSVNYSSYTDTVSFTMPKTNVSLTFDIAQAKTINVTPNENIADYYFTRQYSSTHVTSVNPGETIQVYATPVEGYEITNIYYQTGKACSKNTWGGYWTFKYPEEGEINIVFETATKKTVSYSSSEAYNLTLDETSYLPGETVDFSVTPNLGYTITNVTTDNEEANSSLKESSYTKGDYSFVMPDANVNIVVEYEEVETHTLTFTVPEQINSFKITDSYGNTISSGDKVNTGETLTISFTSLETGFNLDSLTLSDGTSLTKVSDTKYTFIMPNSDVTLTAVTSEQAKHAFSLEEGTDPRVSVVVREQGVSYGNGFEMGYEGMDLTATFTLDDSTDNYYIDASSIKITTVSGQDVEITNYPASGDTTKVNFTMPTEDIIFHVEVKAYEKYPLTVIDPNGYLKFNEGYSGPVITDFSGFKEGTSLKVVINGTDLDFDNFKYELYLYKTNVGKVEGMVSGFPKKFSRLGDYWTFTTINEPLTVELVITPIA